MVKENWHKINFGGLTALFLVAGVILASFFWVNQEKSLSLRGKATGSGVIKITLSADKSSLKQGESATIRVILNPVSNQQIRVAGADISFNSDIFSVSAVGCGSNLSSVAKAQVVDNKVLLSCFRPGGSSALVMVSDSPIVLGSFKLTAKAGAVLGASAISFSRTNVPEAETSSDLADAGTAKSISVVQGDSTCFRKTEGDADCNGQINLADFFVWRGEFLKRSGEMSDFDQDGSIGIGDFFLWRSFFLRAVL